MATVTAASSVRTRTFRIEENIWKPFSDQAKAYGLSATAYLKSILIRENQKNENTFSIDEIEKVEIPKSLQPKLKKLSNAASAFANTYR